MTITTRLILRNALVGFGLGMIVVSSAGLLATSLAARTPVTAAQP